MNGETTPDQNDGLRSADPSNPKEGELLSNAELHIAVQDWKKAVPLLTELLEGAPENPRYNALLARALGKCSGLERHAERQFHRALQMAPQDPEVHYAFGEFYLSMGREARAEQQFQETLRLAPGHKGARREIERRRKQQASLGARLKKLFR